MTNKTSGTFSKLQKFEFAKWNATLWLVKRSLLEKQAKYKILRVDIDNKLAMRLKNSLHRRITDRDYKLEEYSFMSADQDEQVFTVGVDGTDFDAVRGEINKGLLNEKVTSFDELLNSWAYVVKLELGAEAVYGWRKINSLSKVKKVQSLTQLMFRNTQLVDIDDEQIFTIDTNFDFFAYEDTLFILNKRDFETALNFRAGMEATRDAVLDQFVSMNLFDDIEPLRAKIGSHLSLLRKLSAIEKSGYYKNVDFMKKLPAACKKNGWGLKFKNGQIIVTHDCIDLILTVLNNSRLKSPINEEVFDADVKRRVTL